MAVIPVSGRIEALLWVQFWGLVFSYLEVLRTSELLGAGLRATFIVASGMVRSVGKSLIVYFDVPEFWMPVTTGLIFTPLLFVSVYALSLLPEPDAADEAARQKRQPMTAAALVVVFPLLVWPQPP